MSFLRKLLGLDISDYLERAERYEKLGRLGLARLELEKAWELVSLDDQEGRQRIAAKLDRIAAKEQVDAVSQGREALQKGDNKRARYYFNVALSKLDDTDREYQGLLDLLRSVPQDDEDEEDDLTILLRADVGVSFMRRQRSLEFWKSGFPPYREEYYFNKALTSEVLKSQAERVRENSDDADACFNFGITLSQLGLVDKALEQLRKFVKLKPDDRDGHYFLANLLADQGYDDEAIREFERTISLDSSFSEAYFYLAEHYSDLEDFDHARKLYQHVIELEPQSPLAEESKSKLDSIDSRSQDAQAGNVS